jgi:3-dehydroquinate dehydratase-2
MTIQIINGPNLNLLGVREPGIYGSASFDQYLQELKRIFPDTEIAFFQSNSEGEIINKIHETGFSCSGIVLNAGAYTHSSIAIHDAIKSITAPVVEVHISNVHARETFRRQSMLAPACKGVIAGFGLDSYRLAILALIASQKSH